MIVTTRKHSYFVNDLATVELGSAVLDLEKNQMYMHLNPIVAVASVEELANAIAAGGNVSIVENIDAPTAFEVKVDTVITNNGVITISEDTDGSGVFMVTEGTLTLDGNGTINGLGKNDYNMAIWAKNNGKVIINNGYFTNVGAAAENDPSHFDLVYASGNAQIEINGGEFKCETPKWTLNIKDKDRATANIVVNCIHFRQFTIDISKGSLVYIQQLFGALFFHLGEPLAIHHLALSPFFIFILGDFPLLQKFPLGFVLFGKSGKIFVSRLLYFLFRSGINGRQPLFHFFQFFVC